MYIYVYIYIHTHIYTHIHNHTHHNHTHTHIFTSLFGCYKPHSLHVESNSLTKDQLSFVIMGGPSCDTTTSCNTHTRLLISGFPLYRPQLPRQLLFTSRLTSNVPSSGRTSWGAPRLERRPCSLFQMPIFQLDYLASKHTGHVLGVPLWLSW